MITEHSDLSKVYKHIRHVISQQANPKTKVSIEEALLYLTFTPFDESHIFIVSINGDDAYIHVSIGLPPPIKEHINLDGKRVQNMSKYFLLIDAVARKYSAQSVEVDGLERIEKKYSRFTKVEIIADELLQLTTVFGCELGIEGLAQHIECEQLYDEEPKLVDAQ